MDTSWEKFADMVVGFQYSPWGFIAFVLGLAGAIMAGPPLLQMIYARPKIVMRFSESHDKPGGSVIGMHIHNDPITSKFLDWFGIARLTADSVICHYQIWDAASGKELFPVFFPLISMAVGEKAKRVSLPASRFAAFVPIGAVKEQKVYVDTADGKLHLLPIGRYKVKASVEYGNKVTWTDKYLVVRTSDPYGFWEVES